MKTGDESLMHSAKEALLNERVRVRAQATEMLALLLEKNGIAPEELATSMGKRPRYVTRILAGAEEIDLEELAEMFFRLGNSLHLYADQLGTRHYPQESLAKGILGREAAV
jgi:hypothetical protein